MVAETNYDLSRERVTDFLKNFYTEDNEGSKSFPYIDQIETIAQREQVSFYIFQDHVNEHDPELSDWVAQNTCRYRSLFYEVVDKLVSEILGENEVKKIF